MTSKIIATNVLNIYSQPSTDSTLDSQATSGAQVIVRDEKNGLSLIETEDRFQGWVLNDHLAPEWDDTDYFKTSVATLFADVYPKPDPSTELLTKLTVGTKVIVAHRAEVDDWVPILLPNQTTGYVHRVSLNMTHDGSIASSKNLDSNAERATDVRDLKRKVLKAVGIQAIGVGKRFIGTPYLWGGTTPFGIDCSGFVQLSYRLSGVQLLRDAYLQLKDRRFMPIEEGKAFDEADFQPGDLLGFRRPGAERAITHIGMALGDERFLHSSGGIGVHIDPRDTEKYKREFVRAIRISPDADLAIDAA